MSLDHPPETAMAHMPAYLRVVRQLSEQIRAGAYPPGGYLPPERDLASGFSVSRPTVRQALAHLRNLGVLNSERGRGTRVLMVPPNPEIQDNTLRLAGLVIYGISREGSAFILQGCQTVMSRAGYHLIVCETPHDMPFRLDGEAFQLRSLIERNIRGIIIYAEPNQQNRELLRQALHQGVQIVQVDRYVEGLECDYVGVDNYAACAQITEHLWNLGHRRIAFLSDQTGPSSTSERYHGYRLTLGRNGAIDPDLEILALQEGHPGNTSLPDITTSVRRLLALPSPPTAIVAVNDNVAIHAIRVLHDEGMDVPGHMAVVGFDDQEIAGLVSPPLTTVHQPFRAIGESAADMLLGRLEGRYAGVHRRVLLPTHLVVRRSCGSRGCPSKQILRKEQD